MPLLGFLGGSGGKESAIQATQELCSLDPWFGKILWRRAWRPTPVFLPRASCGQRSLAGYSPQGQKELVCLKRPFLQFSSVQSLSHVRLFAIPWTAAHQASLSITNSRNLFRLMSVESVIPSNHLILCCPLLLPPSIFPSIRVFSNKPVLRIRWPKYWSFSFSISPFNEDSGLISFRMVWLDLLAVQGTLKSLLQHHSSKVSEVNKTG